MRLKSSGRGQAESNRCEARPPQRAHTQAVLGAREGVAQGEGLPPVSLIPISTLATFSKPSVFSLLCFLGGVRD